MQKTGIPQLTRLLATALLCLTGLAAAAPPAAPVQLAADQAWQPFILPEKPGGGLVTDLVVSSFRAAGRDATLDYLTWSRVLKATAEGNYDGIAGAYHTDQRARRFLYSEPFLRFRVSLIGRRGFPMTAYNTVSELKGHTVGIIKDAAYPESLRKSGLRLHRSASREGLVRMLREGRIDLLADTEDLFHHHALKVGLNPDDFVILTPPLSDEPLFVMAPRALPGSKQLIEDFNRGLEALKQDGRYLEIRRRYGF